MMLAGLKLKTFATARGDDIVRHLARAHRVDPDAHGFGVADGVGDLQFADLRQPGGDDVLRHPAAHVGGRAIDLRRILAGEGAAAVAAPAAIGVDDDLAAGHPGVALGTADDKTAGRD